MKQLLRPATRRRSLTFAALALTVGALTCGTRPLPIVHAATLSRAPFITATIHDNWTWSKAIPPNFRYEVMHQPHYTLHVTGVNFVPGAQVNLALLRLDALQVLQRGSISAQGAYLYVPQAQRSIPNPRAGTFDYTAAVGLALRAGPLRLWSRSASRLRIDIVTRT